MAQRKKRKEEQPEEVTQPQGKETPVAEAEAKPAEAKAEAIEAPEAEAEPEKTPEAEVAEAPAPEADRVQQLEEKVKELEARLAETQSKADEYLDQWRRTAAEFANYRKRIEKERAEQAKYANAALLTKLLPLLDDFDRAFQTLPDGLAKLTWIEGIFLIHRKLNFILEQEGVKPIETQGKFFDPAFHEAVTYEEVDGYEDGQIIGEVQKGYMLHDRVLRPALVRVAKARKKEEPQPESAPSEDSEKTS